MAKAYSYIRFSTPEQSKGDSLRRQTVLSDAYIAANGLELADLKLQDLGISAFDKSNLTKGALGKFLELVNAGEIAPGSFLLIESLDRLSRAQVMDALSVFTSIINADINIVTLADKVTYSKSTLNENWANLIMSIVIMSRAAEESLTKSRRIKASWENKKNQLGTEIGKILTARCPNWMRAKSDRSGFELIPENAKTAKRILQLAKDGHGNSSITRILNEERVNTFSKNSPDWQPSYIQKLLTSKACFGAFEFKLHSASTEQQAVLIHDYFPKIIDQGEWENLQLLRKLRRSRGGVRKGPGISNLFSGLLKCAYCGGSMAMGADTKTKYNGTSSKRYVACSRARRGVGCVFIKWHYKELEESILSACKKVDFNKVMGVGSEVRNALNKKATLINDKKVQLNDTNQKIKRLVQQLENGESSRFITERLSELEHEFEILSNELTELQSIYMQEEAALLSKENSTATIQSVIAKLQELEGNDLIQLRAKLSFQIHSSIRQIMLKPGGDFLTPEKKASYEAFFKANNLTDTINIADFYKRFQDKPNKLERTFFLIFDNNEFLRVSSDGTVNHNLNEMNLQDYLNVE